MPGGWPRRRSRQPKPRPNGISGPGAGKASRSIDAGEQPPLAARPTAELCLVLYDGVASGNHGLWVILATEREAEPCYDQVADGHRNRAANAERRAVDKAEKRQYGAGGGKECRPIELAVDDKGGDGAEDQSREHRTAAEQRHAVVDNPGGAELGHADLLGGRARRAERAVYQGLRPGGDVRQDRKHDCGRVPRRRRPKRLGADNEADIEQAREGRAQRNEGEQQTRQPQEAPHADNDTGRQRVADPAADRLPSGVADIDGWRKGAAEQCTDDGTDAVRQQNLAQTVVVAGGSGALHIVHTL